MLLKAEYCSSILVLVLAISTSINGHLSSSVGNIDVVGTSGHSGLDVSITSIGKAALSGQLGRALADKLGNATETCEPGESDTCFEWGDFARLYLTAAKDENENCATVEWYSPYARRLEDCFNLQEGVHWYGGASGPYFWDVWPEEQAPRAEHAMFSGDGWDPRQGGQVTENYWLLSSGVAIHADETNPLFFSMNTTRTNQACLVSEDVWPYKGRGEARLKYDICVGRAGENFKDVHQRAQRRYYNLPKGIPDVEMLTKPFYSTWAEYKMFVNESVVMEMANNLIKAGFTRNSHLEIDDFWETCYGENEFDFKKFPDPARVVANLKKLGFRTTIWVTPFINIDCPAYQVGVEKGYFIKDQRGTTAMMTWWQGNNSAHIDYTNEEAVAWWSGRLKSLQSRYNIDAFKFDAGEIGYIPASYQLKGDQNKMPGYATTKYIQEAAKFGGLVEVRSSRQNQDLPIFPRMLDKDSKWGYDNGLQSLIPTLLHFGVVGYPFCLPDMIGGNAYGSDGWVGAIPGQQLYTRWMQANAFMPGLQFSVLPMHYDAGAIKIIKDVLDIRAKHEHRIIDAALQAVKDGSPVNRPMWWVDPTDVNTLTIDDQYMLGDDLLVAPVLKENATSRDIYLPRGRWTISMNATSDVTYQGPQLLKDFPAPLDFLPYFIRELSVGPRID